jgi:hypothetical protein
MFEPAESQAGSQGGMSAGSQPDEEVAQGSEGMPDLELQAGMSEVSTVAAVGEDGVSELSTAAAVGQDGMSEVSTWAVGSAGMSESGEVVLVVVEVSGAEPVVEVSGAEPVVEDSGMWGSSAPSSTASGIPRHSRWDRRVLHPDDSGYVD